MMHGPLQPPDHILALFNLVSAERPRATHSPVKQRPKTPLLCETLARSQHAGFICRRRSVENRRLHPPHVPISNVPTAFWPEFDDK